MSKRLGLLYEMKQFLQDNYKNNNTKKTYLRALKSFCNFVKDNKITANYVRNNAQEVLQKYADSLMLKNRQQIPYTHIWPHHVDFSAFLC